MDIDARHKDLGFLLMSNAWNEVMKPEVARRVKGLYAQLIDPSTKRKDRLPDDFIRGQIEALKWMLEWPEKEMQLVSGMLREQEEMNAQRGPTPQ
jgi:hypothetical protein